MRLHLQELVAALFNLLVFFQVVLVREVLRVFEVLAFLVLGRYLSGQGFGLADSEEVVMQLLPFLPLQRVS